MDEWKDRARYYDNITWVRDLGYIDRLIDMMRLKGEERVLDVGCGTGLVLKRLKIRYPKLSLYGVDSSPQMLSMAGDFNLGLADATSLPYENFDVVFARMLLHHLLGSSLEQALEEMKRVSRKVVIAESVPIKDYLIDDFIYILRGKENRWYFTGRDIEKLLKDLGLKNIRRKDVILKSQSIMNWLDNSNTSKSVKRNILERHHKVSNKYKRVANFQFTDDDIFSDMRHIIVAGEV